MGFLTGSTDNAGHVGGLICGLLLGYATLVPILESEISKKQVLAGYGLLALLLGGLIGFYAFRHPREMI